ncbi:uncharacterized protein LOC132749145 [Ruditapes philippinarum]|uniref:uncharacterized protein LOC132749145 n=1 Tax=Ruditapes philippinarum TaxID=129788 RepID=UPI00295B6000|nr:uncharacterized protein LOC132749145 [Ruditapes philippinarum]
MMSVVREGYVKRYSKSLLKGGWKDIYLMLYSDSTLLAFKRHGDGNPKVRICMRDVCKHFAYGEHAARNFRNLPPLSPGADISCILAIPERPNRHSKPHFFLMQNGQDMHEWMSAICSTIDQSARMGQEQNYFQPTPYNYGPQYGGACSTQPRGYGGPVSSGQYPSQQPVYQTYQGYPTHQPGYPQQQSYGYQQPVQGHSQGHHKKGGGFPGGKAGKIAAGLLGGAALGYGAKKMLGGFGKFGMGRSGSWSSFDSFGSGGSCGSFGSFD